MQLLKVAEREFEIALDDAALDSADFGVWWPIERKHTERSRNIRVRRLAVRKGLVSKFKQIPFAQFYRDHLKKYAGVRWLARRLNWFKVYSSYVNLLTAVLYSKHAREWRKVLALADFVKKKGVASCDLVDAEQIEIPQPMVYPSGAREYPASFLDQYSFPRLFVATINDAKVYGGTNLILADDGMVICHDLYDFAHDYTAEELHGLTFHDHDNKHIRWLSYDEAPEVVPICATFVDACAVNYAHWLTEVLPRIALFCSDRRFQCIPIVVNDGLHKNIMESLLAICDENREVIVLPTGRALAVQNLYVTSVTGYVPFEPRNGNRPRRQHRGEFSRYALGALRDRVKALCQLGDGGVWPERIYLRRTSEVRKLTNATMLEDLLIMRDFVIIEPEKLSFHLQAQLFANAKVVVGATGAAFANTVFCQPGTQVAILVAKHKDLVYEYWVNMLMPIGVKVSYIFGKGRESTIHSNFEIEPTNLAEFLNTLDKGR